MFVILIVIINLVLSPSIKRHNQSSSASIIIPIIDIDPQPRLIINHQSSTHIIIITHHQSLSNIVITVDHNRQSYESAIRIIINHESVTIHQSSPSFSSLSSTIIIIIIDRQSSNINHHHPSSSLNHHRFHLSPPSSSSIINDHHSPSIINTNQLTPTSPSSSILANIFNHTSAWPFSFHHHRY